MRGPQAGGHYKLALRIYKCCERPCNYNIIYIYTHTTAHDIRRSAIQSLLRDLGPEAAYFIYLASYNSSRGPPNGTFHAWAQCHWEGRGGEEERERRRGREEESRKCPEWEPGLTCFLVCVYITIIIVGVPRLIDAHAPTVFGRHIQAG